MLVKVTKLLVVMFFVVTTISFAQNQLDGRPLDLEKDPDIDMFIGSWQNSIPYNTHGSLTERAILTRLEGNDFLNPQRKGAVLQHINRFSRATLDPHASTIPVTLKGEQEILYITCGEGIIKAGKDTAKLHDGIFVLMPEGLEFTITNTGDELLEIYLVNEPVPAGFKPNREMVVKNEKTMPFRDQGILKVHWSHNGKNIFTPDDGLSSLSTINLITMNAMTIGRPHSHGEEMEEIWTVIEGKAVAFLGKEIRWQYPGTAYMIPQTGYTPHSNINVTEKPVKYLYVARRAE